MTDRPRVYEFGPFRLHAAEHTLYRDGAETPLTPKLFDLLLVLVEAGGRTVDKDGLMAAVWPDVIVEEGSLTRSISRLRAVLGDDTGDERFIRTVSRRGYRFVAPVLEVASGHPDPPLAPVPAPSEEPEVPVGVEPGMPPTDAPAARRLVRWRAVGALVAVGVAAAVLVVSLSNRGGDAPAVARPRSLAVLPFQPLEADPSDEALGLGLADSLITRLANQALVAVRPTSAVLRVTNGSIDSIAAGQALSVDAILEGTVRRLDGQYRVSARLVDVRDGSQLWGSTFDETSASLIDVEDNLTRRLAEALSIVLESTGRAAHGGTSNADAYEAYLRGRFLTFKLTKDAFAEARRQLSRAIALDPEFARAHAAVGYLHLNTVDLVAPPRQAFPAAREAVARALALDPMLADAHATLGLIEWQYEWNWAAAEREFRRAIELEPSGAFARSQYAFFLGALGRADESIAESERARSLDPLTLDFGATNALTFHWARRHAEAAERISRVTSVDPNYWLGQVILGRTLEAQGALDQAIAVYERALRLEGALPEALMDLGRAHAAAGHRQKAERVLADLQAFGRREYAAPFQQAVIYSALGEKDRAFEEIDKAIEARSWYVTWLMVDPSLDPLRSDGRFDTRLRRVGFPPGPVAKGPG